MLGHHNNAVAFCSTTWTQVLLKPARHVVAKVFLCMCKCWKRHGHFVAKVMSSPVQLLKSKGKILLCQGCWNKWAKAIFGKSGARQPHSIALGLRIFLATANRIGVTTSALKFERVYVCVYIYTYIYNIYLLVFSIYPYLIIFIYWHIPTGFCTWQFLVAARALLIHAKGSSTQCGGISATIRMRPTCETFEVAAQNVRCVRSRSPILAPIHTGLKR